MTAVWFWNPADAADERGFWDQGLLEELFASEAPPAPGYELREPALLPPEGAVIVIPGQHNVAHADWIGEVASALPWALVIVTSDEEALFPLERLPRDATHAVWTQYHDRGMDAVIPIGPPPGTRLTILQVPFGARRDRWFFAGQVTHPRRRELVAALDGMAECSAFPTDGFGPTAPGALPRVRYLAHLAAARGAPCPSGPHSLDSFRLYEALEAGCVPVVETHTPHGPDARFWDAVLGADCPIPVVDSWAELAGIDPTPQLARACHQWWRRYTRALGGRLAATCARLSE